MKFNHIFYIFLITIIAIQIFDREDKYFFIQVIFLAILIILAIYKWRNDTKNGVD